MTRTAYNLFLQECEENREGRKALEELRAIVLANRAARKAGKMTPDYARDPAYWTDLSDRWAA